jgi:hypothetical protein
MDLVSGFPRNLAYTLKQLSNFTKQTVKVMPDRTNPSLGEVSRFKLPASAMIDFRTISIFADVSLYNNYGTAAANYNLHLPRNTASLIQQITITCNGVQLCNINDYNLLFNTLYDLEGADISQTSKRFLENADPSVFYYQGTSAVGNTPIGCVNAQDGSLSTNVESSRPIVMNNFIGMLGSLSTPVLDLNDTGDIYIEIRWASPSVCWATTNAAAATAFNTTTNCSFNNLRMTCAKINFESSEYYDLKAQKLLNDGLLVGYYDYWTSRGTAVAKSAGVNMNFNVATNSLDQCIATFQKSDYNTIKNLVLHNSGTSGSLITFNKFLYDQIADDETAAGIGDGFNQSYYFMRAGVDLATSQWSINSTNIDPYPLPPSEVWNANLIALGNANIDYGTSGVHPGCVSLWHFLKYYFCHILSLENLSGDGAHWRSGLSGNGSVVNINYQATFANYNNGTTNTENISPVIFCRSTKVLSIKSGHIISVV